MIALPIYLQLVLEYNALQAGLSLAPLSLTMFAIALLAGKRAGKRRPSSIIRMTSDVAMPQPIARRAGRRHAECRNDRDAAGRGAGP